jgi:hypothetical protein
MPGLTDLAQFIEWGMGLCGALLATASPLYGDWGVADLAPRLVECEVAEHGCGLPPVKLAVCVSTPVSFSGEISGRRSLGGDIIRRLPLFRFVSL